MVSIIKVTSIQDTSGNNETTTANIKKAYDSSPKMFANFNGTGTPTARKSLNLSSLTDNGTGHYRLTFTSAFSDNDYASPSAAGDSTGTSARIAMPHENDDATTTYYDIRVDDTASTAIDAEHIHTATFGDLA